MEELDQYGNPIYAGQNNINGTVSTTGKSATSMRSQTDSTSSSQEVKENLLAGENAYQIEDPGEYQKQPYVQSPLFADMLRAAEERRNKAKQNNLSEQDRERRRNKYLAWTNFGQALGGLAGAGYAPAEKQDNKRVLDSYAKLDALRKEYDAIDAADNISWIQKLALQTQLQHDAQEQARYDAREKERQRIQELNYRFQNAKVGSVTNREGEKRSITNTDSQTLSDSFRKMLSTNVKYGSPEWEALKASIGNNAAAQRPVVWLGQNDDLGINRTEALDMAKQVGAVVDAINGGMKPTNGYYVTDDGVRFPADKLEKEVGRIRNMVNNIMSTFANGDDEKSDFALASFVKNLDKLTGYAFRDYFARMQANRAGNNPPVAPPNGGKKKIPGIGSGNVMP